MLIANVTARLVLCIIFAAAGFAKLADLAGSREMLAAFGVPRRLATPFGVLLPLAELAVAAMLVPAASVWPGAIGALFLLATFIIGISYNLARGHTPDCHCFGQLHSAPAGWSTLARNVLLAFGAGLLVWQGRNHAAPSLVSWVADLTIPQRVALFCGIAGFALLAAQAAILLQIMKQQGRILLRLDALETSPPGSGTTAQSAAATVGLPIGSPAPSFRLQRLDGKTTSLEDLVSHGKPVILFFTNPNCGPCQALLPEVGRWQREHDTRLAIVLVSEGSAAENRAKTAKLGVAPILLQQKREVAEIYQAWGTPAAVLIWPDGTIGSPTAQGADAIRALVTQGLAGARTPRMAAAPGSVANGPNGNGHVAPSPIAKPGDLAPPLKLRDLKGKTVALTALRNRKTLVLFWNPGCGFCRQMLDDLRDWDAAPPPGAPALVVVSTGTAEDGRAMDLRSPILLDSSNQAGAAFGAHGTPMAVLLDAGDRVASEIAAGAQAVFVLAGAASADVQQFSNKA
jgi:thiol-disulfide isomerase/thioredoxin/uncharacterized membrane protein YphA (DoxX/SURF4 family)